MKTASTVASQRTASFNCLFLGPTYCMVFWTSYTYMITVWIVYACTWYASLLKEEVSLLNTLWAVWTFPRSFFSWGCFGRGSILTGNLSPPFDILFTFVVVSIALTLSFTHLLISWTCSSLPCWCSTYGFVVWPTMSCFVYWSKRRHMTFVIINIFECRTIDRFNIQKWCDHAPAL